MSLTYEASELIRRIAQAVQQEWKEVLGIEVELDESDFKNLVSKMQNRNYSIGLNYWVVQYTDPVSILERFKHLHSKKNFPGYENPEYIELLDQAAAINDPEERMKLLERAEALIISDMPLAPIYHYNQVFLKNSKFKNIQFSLLGNLIYKKIEPANLGEGPFLDEN